MKSPRPSALLRQPSRRLERDVTADPVVERTRGDAVAGQRQRRAVPERCVPGTHELLELVAVLRANVEDEILVLDRLALLAPPAALLSHAGHHDTRQRPVSREHVDPLADHHGRVEAADLADGGHAVVAEVRDDGADLVDVADDRERRAAGRARHA